MCSVNTLLSLCLLRKNTVLKASGRSSLGDSFKSHLKSPPGRHWKKQLQSSPGHAFVYLYKEIMRLVCESTGVFPLVGH